MIYEEKTSKISIVNKMANFGLCAHFVNDTQFSMPISKIKYYVTCLPNVDFRWVAIWQMCIPH